LWVESFSKSGDWSAKRRIDISVVPLTALVMDFQAIHNNVFGSANAEAHPSSVYFDDHYVDVAADDDLFPNFA
jgi:hypothetical protein